MVKFSLIRLNITNWRINPLRKHLSILGQNDPGLREIFLEFNCCHFGKKIESLQLSCQKLTFDHIWASGVTTKKRSSGWN